MNNIKPILDKNTKRLLKIKNRQARKRVEFRRQEWFRYEKFGEEWRKPRGKHSKLREHLSRRPPVVDAGFRGPAAVRGLHPSGFKEVLVHNMKELEAIDKNTQACRLASSIGRKKRVQMEERADQLGIRVLNRSVE
jgi:large subunit ribosomal protein L32e